MNQRDAHSFMKIFGNELNPKEGNDKNHLIHQLFEFNKWDCGAMQHWMFIHYLEELLGCPVEPELVTYVKKVDSGQEPYSFNTFMRVLKQGKNTLSALQTPIRQTNDDLASLIHDNSGPVVKKNVIGEPIKPRTDLYHDDYINAEKYMQGKARKTNMVSQANPLQPTHDLNAGADVDVILRMFLDGQIKERDFRDVLNQRHIPISDQAERAIQSFVNNGYGTFTNFRKFFR